MENENIIHTRKIRIYPNKPQRELFTKCFGASRYIYNKAVDYVKNKVGPVTLIDIRKSIMPSYKKLKAEDDEFWLTDIPYDTVQLAIKNFVTNYKAIMTTYKKSRNPNKVLPEQGYLEKSNPYQWMHANKDAFSVKRKIFPQRLGLNSTLKFGEKDLKWWYKNVKGIDHDFIITKEYNKYYLCYVKSKPKSNNTPEQNMIALDPGVRTFASYFDNKGNCGKFGDNFTENLRKYQLQLDKLSSKKKRSCKNRCELLRAKITNIVTNLHWKVSSYLVKNYDCIFLPIFKTKQMISRDKNLPNIVVRDMQALSHYKFKLRLKHLANIHNKCVIDCSEKYTSVTCTNCGNLHQNLNANKIYNCVKCQKTFDRDINAARNILIKNITHLFD